MTHGPSETCWTSAGIWGNTDLPGLTVAISCNKASVQLAVKYMASESVVKPIENDYFCTEMESGDDTGSRDNRAVMYSSIIYARGPEENI